MERRKFEDDFAHAFKDAGITPGDQVWTNIELDLERQQGKKMKRRVLFYQLLAAASVSFAVIMAGLGYYAMTTRPDAQTLATIESGKSDERGPNSTSEAKESILPSTSSVPSVKENEAQRRHDVNEKNHMTPSAEDDQLLASRTMTGVADNANSGLPRPTGSRNDAQSPPSAEKDQLLATREESSNADRKNLFEDTSDNVNAGSVNRKSSTNNEIVGASSEFNLAQGTLNRTGATDQIVVEKTESPTVASPATENVFPTSAQAHERSALPVNTEQSIANSKLPALYQASQPSLSFEKKEESIADPGQLMLAQLKDLEKELSGETSKKSLAKSERLWTSVGFSAGGFNSANPSISSEPSRVSQSMFTVDNTAGVNNQAKASGTAYSAGVSMGTRLSDRWVIQGGVNYLTQISSYTADVAFSSADLTNFKAASLNEFSDGRLSSENVAIPTAPYSVYSNVEILTLPVQAGYIIVNRKVALQLNAGVSSDIFLQNTIDPEGQTIQKTTQGAGADSPYRTFNMSGLFGTELSYRFADRYRITLNPGLRYPLNSIYKEDTGVNASPLIFDLGLRFRYIFQ